MKILAIDRFRPGVTIDQVRPLLKEEARHGYELYSKGVFREMYLRADGRGAALVLECADVAEAERVLGELPLVKANLIEFEVMPLAPFPFANAFS